MGRGLQSVETRAIAAETNDVNLAARLDALAAEVARTNTAVVETDMRTRDLFLLAVARRMLEAGRPLTPIERALENRFREADGAAVDALAAWTAAPQTQRTLKDRLKALQEMPEAADTRSWWDRLTSRLAGLVTVRGQTAETAPTRMRCWRRRGLPWKPAIRILRCAALGAGGLAACRSAVAGGCARSWLRPRTLWGGSRPMPWNPALARCRRLRPLPPWHRLLRRRWAQFNHKQKPVFLPPAKLASAVLHRLTGACTDYRAGSDEACALR